MTNPTLFDLPTVPHNHTETSIAAAKKLLKKCRTELDEEALFVWLQFRGSYGATDEEIQGEFSWTGDYSRPRRWKLVKDGRVEWLGAKRVNGNGNEMKCWTVKPVLTKTPSLS